MLTPDAILDVKFLETKDGGRKMPTPSNYFGCIFQINNCNHDGRLLLENHGSIYPGENKKNVPVKFLCSDDVMPKLKVGSKLILKEGHVIGEAEVLRIINVNT